MSDLGLKLLLRDFNNFDVELDVKCGESNYEDQRVIEESFELLEDNANVDLKINRILNLNCSNFNTFVRFFS